MTKIDSDRAAVRVFWWQGGLHLEPNGADGLSALEELKERLLAVREAPVLYEEVVEHRRGVPCETPTRSR